MSKYPLPFTPAGKPGTTPYKFGFLRTFPDGRQEWLKLPRADHLKINVTYVCDRKCLNCNRTTQYAPDGHACDMTPEQLGDRLTSCAEAGMKFIRIILTGGEPTMHPEIGKLIDAAFAYRDKHDPKCAVRIVTYHHPVFHQRILDALKKHPDLQVEDTDKKAPRVHRFATYMAPIDTGDFPEDHVWVGCHLGSALCGICLDYSGFYCCPVAAAIARVFKLDLAIKEAKDISLGSLTDQYKPVCSLCGYYKSTKASGTQEPMSASWKKAIDEYRASKGLRTLK